MRFFHIHLAEKSEHHGAHQYDTCRCGARRTLRHRYGYSPLSEGWPKPEKGWTK